MQTDGQFGGSTPSIYNALSASNYDHTDGKAFDHSNGIDVTKVKSERNYYDVNKIDFEKSIYLNGPPCSSDSSSSDNSFFSDGREHESDDHKLQHEDDTDGAMLCARKNQSILPRCKNSTENLSEDSGYGEFNSLRHRSKSIPSFNQDYFIEEEELENHKSLENVYARAAYCLNGMGNKSTAASTTSTEEASTAAPGFGRMPTSHQRPKIAAPSRGTGGSAALPTTTTRFDEFKNIRGHGEVQRNSDIAGSRKVASSASASSLSSLQNSNISASLPDILDHLSVFGESGDSSHQHLHSERRGAAHASASNSSRDSPTPFYNKDLSIVSSVPNNLNICAEYGDSSSSSSRSNGNRDDIDCCSFNSVLISSRHTSGSVASKNFDLGNFECRPNGGGVGGGSGTLALNDQHLRQQKIINASYSNLTLLDYSGGAGNRTPLGSSLRIMADKQKRSSLELSRGGSSLLDEISAHFDRDLSIMNDQKRNYDPSDTFLRHERNVVTRPTQPPPQPPPRRQFATVTRTDDDAIDTVAVQSHPPQSAASSATSEFEREIFQLDTRFSDSLEDCNYESDASTDDELDDDDGNEEEDDDDDDEDDDNLPAAQSTPIKRDLVASTPNLYLVKRDCGEDFMPIISSAHNSMTTLPQNGLSDKGRGILSGSSRNSLGKGVSFCPVVAEISWREQSSEEGVESFDSR